MNNFGEKMLLLFWIPTLDYRLLQKDKFKIWNGRGNTPQQLLLLLHGVKSLHSFSVLYIYSV